MKRLINYIKNLFGAEEQLRKWCVEQAIKANASNLAGPYNYLTQAIEIERYVKQLRG